MTLPQPYDAVSYDHYVQATYVVHHADTMCSDPQLVNYNIRYAITLLDEATLYDKYRNEPQLLQATSVVRSDLQQLVDAYTKPPAPSVGYCHLKLQISGSSLEHILEAMGGKSQ